MIPFSLIVALDSKHGIGKKGGLPWHLPGDLKHFKEITSATKSVLKKNIVIMGRKTWDSIPEKFRPLPGRMNCVLTHNKSLSFPKDVLVVDDFNAALQKVSQKDDRKQWESVFVIGGAQVFATALNHPQCQRLYITHIEQEFGCDTFFPPIPSCFVLSSQSSSLREDSISYYFAEYYAK